MLGSGIDPRLRQQEKWHASSEKERFGRPVVWQSSGSRTTYDRQIGVHAIQRNAVVEIPLVEEAKLEADVFTAAICREISFRIVDHSCFPCLIGGNDLLDGLPSLNK
jgi:hypothetical protein